MKNSRCFIVISTNMKSWKRTAHNMEEKVESDRFNLIHGRFHDEHFVAVSPRTVINGKEKPLKRWFKLRRSILSCSTVYALKEWERDKECRKLVRFARITFRHVIRESWEELI